MDDRQNCEGWDVFSSEEDEVSSELNEESKSILSNEDITENNVSSFSEHDNVDYQNGLNKETELVEIDVSEKYTDLVIVHDEINDTPNETELQSDKSENNSFNVIKTDSDLFNEESLIDSSKSDGKKNGDTLTDLNKTEDLLDVITNESILPIEVVRKRFLELSKAITPYKRTINESNKKHLAASPEIDEKLEEELRPLRQKTQLVIQKVEKDKLLFEEMRRKIELERQNSVQMHEIKSTLVKECNESNQEYTAQKEEKIYSTEDILEERIIELQDQLSSKEQTIENQMRVISDLQLELETNKAIYSNKLTELEYQKNERLRVHNEELETLRSDNRELQYELSELWDKYNHNQYLLDNAEDQCHQLRAELDCYEGQDAYLSKCADERDVLKLTVENILGVIVELLEKIRADLHSITEASFGIDLIDTNIIHTLLQQMKKSLFNFTELSCFNDISESLIEKNTRVIQFRDTREHIGRYICSFTQQICNALQKVQVNTDHFKFSFSNIESVIARFDGEDYQTSDERYRQLSQQSIMKTEELRNMFNSINEVDNDDHFSKQSDEENEDEVFIERRSEEFKGSHTASGEYTDGPERTLTRQHCDETGQSLEAEFSHFETFDNASDSGRQPVSNGFASEDKFIHITDKLATYNELKTELIKRMRHLEIIMNSYGTQSDLTRIVEEEEEEEFSIREQSDIIYLLKYLSEKSDQLSERIEDILNDKSNELKHKDEALKELSRRLEDLLNDTDMELKRKDQELKESLQRIENLLSSKEAELKRKDELINEMSEQMENLLNDKNAELKRKDHEVRAISERIEEIEDLLNDRETELKRKNETIKEITEQMKTLLNDKERALAEKDRTVKEMTEQVETLLNDKESALRYKDGMIKEMTVQMEVLLDDKESALRSKERTIKEMKERVESLLNDKEDALNNKDRTIKEMSVQLEKMKETLNKNLNVTVPAVDPSLSSSGLVPKVSSEENSKQANAAKVKTIMSQMKSKLQTEIEKNNRLKDELETVRNTLERITEENHRLRVEVNLAAEERSALTAEYSRILDNQLAALKDTFGYGSGTVFDNDARQQQQQQQLLNVGLGDDAIRVSSSSLVNDTNDALLVSSVLSQLHKQAICLEQLEKAISWSMAKSGYEPESNEDVCRKQLESVILLLASEIRSRIADGERVVVSSDKKSVDRIFDEDVKKELFDFLIKTVDANQQLTNYSIELSDSNGQLRSQVERLRGKVDELNGAHKSLLASLDSAHCQKDFLAQSAQRLTDKLQDKQILCDRLRDSIAQLECRNTELSLQLERYLESMTVLTSKVDDYEKLLSQQSAASTNTSCDSKGSAFVCNTIAATTDSNNYINEIDASPITNKSQRRFVDASFVAFLKRCKHLAVEKAHSAESTMLPAEEEEEEEPVDGDEFLLALGDVEFVLRRIVFSGNDEIVVDEENSSLLRLQTVRDVRKKMERCLTAVHEIACFYKEIFAQDDQFDSRVIEQVLFDAAGQALINQQDNFNAAFVFNKHTLLFSVQCNYLFRTHYGDDFDVGSKLLTALVSACDVLVYKILQVTDHMISSLRWSSDEPFDDENRAPDINVNELIDDLVHTLVAIVGNSGSSIGVDSQFTLPDDGTDSVYSDDRSSRTVGVAPVELSSGDVTGTEGYKPVTKTIGEQSSQQMKADQSVDELKLLLQLSNEKIENLCKSLGEVKSRSSYKYHDTLQQKLDNVINQLDGRTKRCEQLSLELTELIKERDSLQLRLSDVLGQNEKLRRENFPDISSVLEPNLYHRQSERLQEKINDIQSIDQSKDPQLFEELNLLSSSSSSEHIAQPGSDQFKEDAEVGWSGIIPSFLSWFESNT